MEIDGKTVLVCDCGGTMKIDGARLARACGAEGAPEVHRALCRSQIAAFEAALAAGKPVVVGCTQEAPLFAETASEDADLRFVNIREHAGWGERGGEAGPKMAALLAAAAIDTPPTPAVTYKSDGVTVVYGRDETAIDAARQLAARLPVSVILDRPEAVMPPPAMDVTVHRGTIVKAQGYLGAFEIAVDDYAPAEASSRTMLEFGAPAIGTIACDLILDLSGATPLFPAPESRDGYFRPDPGNPAAVQRALFDMADMAGDFDKPRYVAYDAAICAHGRNQKIGCTNCLDVCPTGAITPDGDGVAIDPHVCAGCGECASVCPTGAASYAAPDAATLFARLRALTTRYFEAGGAAPVLLLHDRHGVDILAAIGRHGRGLPANVVPFALNEITQVGLDLLLAALAHGCARVVLLAGPRNRADRAAVIGQIELAAAVMGGLGYGAGRVALIDEGDPDALEARLFDLAETDALAAGDFLAMGGKRDRLRLALGSLYANAPVPADAVGLPPSAPFGAVRVETAGCTLCMACVGACPTNALTANPDRPQLSFREDACVQCGLCRATCPESVITLAPRLDFTDAAREAQVLYKEDPLKCLRCGKEFGVPSMVERMIERLRDHPMYAGDPAALEQLRMCEDCRVIAQTEVPQPLAAAPRPRTRTTDDYLKGDADEE